MPSSVSSQVSSASSHLCSCLLLLVLKQVFTFLLPLVTFSSPILWFLTSPHAYPVTFVHSSCLCFLNTLGQRCHKELTSCSFGVQWVVMLMASSHSAHPLQLQFPRACQLSSSLFGAFFPLQGKYAFGFWLTTCRAVLHHWCKQKKSYYWRWRSLPLERLMYLCPFVATSASQCSLYNGKSLNK